MAKKNRTSAGSGRAVTVDMTDVEARVLVPEGDYAVEAKKITEETGGDSGKKYLKWVLGITEEGDMEGQNLYYNTSLQAQSLFNLKNLLVAAGVPVPQKVMKLNLDELEGISFGVTVGHELYDGKKKASVTDVFPLSDAEGSDDGDEAEDEAVDLDEMDLKELKAYAKANDIDLSGLSKKAARDEDKVRAAIAAAAEAEDEADEDEEDEEEVDLDSMDLKAMLKFAKENGIKLGLGKKALANEKKVRKALEDAIEADEDDEEDED